MSDIYTDMIAEYKKLFEDYLGIIEEFYRLKLRDREIHKAEVSDKLRPLTDRLKNAGRTFFHEVYRVPSYALNGVLSLMERREPLPGLTEFLFLLVLTKQIHRLTELLAKTEEFRNSLFVFTDEKWQMTPHYYHSENVPFVDGDQDIALGVAKKFFIVQLKPGFPLVIRRRWDFEAKKWQTVFVLQPLLA